MDLISILRLIWRGLCVLASVISIGRALGWLFDMV